MLALILLPIEAVRLSLLLWVLFQPDLRNVPPSALLAAAVETPLAPFGEEVECLQRSMDMTRCWYSRLQQQLTSCCVEHCEDVEHLQEREQQPKALGPREAKARAHRVACRTPVLHQLCCTVVPCFPLMKAVDTRGGSAIAPVSGTKDSKWPYGSV